MSFSLEISSSCWTEVRQWMTPVFFILSRSLHLFSWKSFVVVFLFKGGGTIEGRKKAKKNSDCFPLFCSYVQYMNMCHHRCWKIFFSPLPKQCGQIQPRPPPNVVWAIGSYNVSTMCLGYGHTCAVLWPDHPGWMLIPGVNRLLVSYSHVLSISRSHLSFFFLFFLKTKISLRSLFLPSSTEKVQHNFSRGHSASSKTSHSFSLGVNMVDISCLILQYT